MGRKVLFISIDTFRKDNLTKDFEGVNCAPFLRGLKERSLFYNNYYGSCNWTIPSYAAMFTGRPTISHNFWSYKHYPAEPARFVFDVLAESGVKPAIIHSNGPLSKDIFQYRTGLYDAKAHPVRNMAFTLQMVLEQLEQSDFVFFHTFMQHNFLFHHRYRPAFGVSRPYRFVGRIASWLMGRKIMRWLTTDHSFALTMQDIRTLERMYYNECLMTDAFLKVLIEKVVSRHPDVRILINSDHGECFSRCGKVIRRQDTGSPSGNPLFGHGSGQCYEQFETFLMVHDPADPKPGVSDELIDHTDMYDLILSEFGLGRFPKGGKKDRLISTGYNFVGNCGVMEGEDFFIYHKKEDSALEFLMYDNLYSDRIADVSEDAMSAYRDELRSAMADEGEAREADEETMEQLRALGYID